MPTPLSSNSHLTRVPRIRVHGHRGARARLPENTLPGFEYAIALSVDALEMDLAVTKDDVIVISHDPILKPPACTGPQTSAVIRQLTLAEVRQWDCGVTANPHFPAQQVIPGARIPTLDEVLQLATLGPFDFNLETKSFLDHPEYTPPPEVFARMVLQKIRRYKVEQRTVLLSFDFRTLAAMRELAPEIRLSALVEDDPRDFTAIAAAAANAEIVSPHFHLVTPRKVEAAHRAGLQIVAWTANTPADWEMLIQANVDAIVSDDPEALLAYLSSKCSR